MIAISQPQPTLITPYLAAANDWADLEKRLDQLNRSYFARMLLSGEAQRLWPYLSECRLENLENYTPDKTDKTKPEGATTDD